MTQPLSSLGSLFVSSSLVVVVVVDVLVEVEVELDEPVFELEVVLPVFI